MYRNEDGNLVSSALIKGSERLPVRRAYSILPPSGWVRAELRDAEAGFEAVILEPREGNECSEST